MTIHITPEITAAYRAFLDEEVDAFVDGTSILRRHTAPYSSNPNCELIGFAAGFQAARAAGVDASRDETVCKSSDPSPMGTVEGKR